MSFHGGRYLQLHECSILCSNVAFTPHARKKKCCSLITLEPEGKLLHRCVKSARNVENCPFHSMIKLVETQLIIHRTLQLKTNLKKCEDKASGKGPKAGNKKKPLGIASPTFTTKRHAGYHGFEPTETEIFRACNHLHNCFHLTLVSFSYVFDVFDDEDDDDDELQQRHRRRHQHEMISFGWLNDHLASHLIHLITRRIFSFLTMTKVVQYRKKHNTHRIESHPVVVQNQKNPGSCHVHCRTLRQDFLIVAVCP